MTTPTLKNSLVVPHWILFVQQKFSEDILRHRYCSSHCGYSSKSERPNTCPQDAYIQRSDGVNHAICAWRKKQSRPRGLRVPLLESHHLAIICVSHSQHHTQMFLLKFLLSHVPTHLTVTHLQSHKHMISSMTHSKFFSDTLTSCLHARVFVFQKN